MNLNRYISLLRDSGQLERTEPSEKPVERGFWTFLGFLAGLAVAWLLR